MLQIDRRWCFVYAWIRNNWNRLNIYKSNIKKIVQVFSLHTHIKWSKLFLDRSWDIEWFNPLLQIKPNQCQVRLLDNSLSFHKKKILYRNNLKQKTFSVYFKNRNSNLEINLFSFIMLCAFKITFILVRHQINLVFKFCLILHDFKWKHQNRVGYQKQTLLCELRFHFNSIKKTWDSMLFLI